MVGKMKKKYSVGEGAQFMSRRAALNKLQLSLNDFRKLCILKGIYPREPRNRKRAQRGEPGIKTLYSKKDILFLLHEPIIWKLRDYKIFARKVGRAKAVKDFRLLRRYLNSHPTIKLDHIVKERYPTFTDALRDLDDCLTLCFLFSTFPSLPRIPRNQFILSKRLTVEFMHAIIQAKALRKVFISIKGYYYQAEIHGQTVTWIVPHHFSFEPQSKHDVDFKIMSTFVEFYIIMLGFVNFRLYHSLNMYYPPKLNALGLNESASSLVDEKAFVAERVAALNIPLTKISNQPEEDEVEIDQFATEASQEDIEKAKKEHAKITTLKTLFKGLKFFLNREVPREPLTFIIRCFGGEVSWDKTLFVGSTFDETDETITHQIIDRPSIDKQYISRYYVQPQWLFDSVNARELLPVNKYFIGAVLPPHLSPFVDKERDAYEQYIPPEEFALTDPALRESLNAEEESENDDVEEEAEMGSDAEGDEDEEEVEMSDGEAEEAVVDESEETRKTQKDKLTVKPGKVYTEEPTEKKNQEWQDYKLRAKMVKNKHRKLYRSMIQGKQKRSQEVWLLKKKRRLIDEKQKAKKGKGKNAE